MTVTIVRISVMYVCAIVIMRLAGKREIGQMELSELVTSFMISEIACMPITDPELPLINGIVFCFAVILLEIILSRGCIKIPVVKRIISGKPSFIVVKGKLDKKEFRRTKISLSEFVSAMRSKGISSVEKISYAVLEPDGTISILPYDDDTKNDREHSQGIEHMLICDGYINKSELERFGYDTSFVTGLLKKHGIKSAKEVFYLGIDDQNNVNIIKNP